MPQEGNTDGTPEEQNVEDRRGGAAVGHATPQGLVPPNLVLRCDYGNNLVDIYSLDDKAGTVRLMTVTPARPGTLTISDSVYRLEFAEDHPREGYYLQLIVNINRFTTGADRVIGRDKSVIYQGQKLQLEAQHDSGTCLPMKGPAF